MIINLKHLASIYTGFTIRESVSYLAHGDIKLLQSKDLPKDNPVINPVALTRIDWKYDSKPHYLDHGSIVLLARGEPQAYLFNGQISDKVIVGHIFIVINLTSNIVNPEYLTWYVNHSSMAKRHFEINSKGTTLNMTSISTVRELPLVVPTIQEQHEILSRNQQANDEAKMFRNLAALRQEYNHAFNEQLITTIHNRQANLQN